MDFPIRLPAAEAYRLWSTHYDQRPNALLHLEERHLEPLLGKIEGRNAVDVGCGTGRWLAKLAAAGARTAGFDLTQAMLAQASAKRGASGRCAQAEATCLPCANGMADLVVCSFTVGYLVDPRPLFTELARITRPNARVFLTEMHPEAAQAGWRRSFRHGEHVYEPQHNPHPIEQVKQAADQTKVLELEAFEDHYLGESEGEMVEQAGGKDKDFDALLEVPALYVVQWRRLEP
jgi:ubiquinone/menaquinone biosynthesis C-methylase UbiE